jgi:hypothetical protein
MWGRKDVARNLMLVLALILFAQVTRTGGWLP